MIELIALIIYGYIFYFVGISVGSKKKRLINFKKRIMKRFKVEGWYRLNDEKDFERITISANTLNNAIEIFKGIYNYLIFYKIDGNEIN